MGEGGSIWVGKDERQGVLAQPRNDAPRAAALAARGDRPHAAGRAACRSARDGRHAVFIEDGDDRSDVWLLDLEDGGAPERLTTGRDPMPYWEDTTPRLSPDGSTVAYADDGHVWLVPGGGRPAAQAGRGRQPAAGSTTRRLLIDVERDEDRPRGSPWSTWTTRGRAASRPRTATSTRTATRATPTCRPDGTEVAYTFTPRADQNRSSEIRVASVETGEVRAAHRRRPTCTTAAPRVVARRRDDRVRLGAERLLRAAPGGRGRRERPPAHERGRRPRRARLAPRRQPHRGRRAGSATASTLVSIDPPDGSATELAPRRRLGRSPAGPRRATWSRPTTTTRPRPSCAASRPARAAALHAPAPLSVRSAPHAAPEDVTFESFDGLEIPAFLMRPRDASPEHPVPAVVYPHGGPTDCYADEWDGHAQYFVDKGYAWLAVNFRGSTGYGRDFERGNHGVWGVDDTKDCLAAADFLRTLDWVDGDRLGIFGASYGSYMSLCAVDRSTPSTASAARCPSTATATSRPRGRRATARRPGPRADDGHAGPGARGVHRRVAVPPARERPGAAPDRARRARRAREPEAVRAARRTRCASSARRSST